MTRLKQAPAIAIATAALFVSLGGGAFASTSTTRVVAPFAIPAGTTRSATAYCPKDTRLVSGGYYSPYPGTRVIESAPSGNGWYVRIHNSSHVLAGAEAIASCNG